MSEPRTAGVSTPRAAAPLRVEWLGEVPYRDGLRLQDEAIAAVRGGGEDRLLLLEHPPVITLGRASKRAHLLEDEATLAASGIEVIEVARGGDVTYHGRGQLVGYLISNLRRGRRLDVHRFVRDLEAGLIDAVGSFGVLAHRVEGRAGVYVPPPPGRPVRKLASIGVGVRHWVSHHGFALNVDIDLHEFDAIVPCGLDDIEMTSLEREGAILGPEFASRVRRAVGAAFARRLGRVAGPG
ncbi:MAG: lipoyl(octanoyl) transferase LipB [bacterium]|nr:lipoyl(octanoyl) transferase LipB [bacterium]